MYFQTLAPVVQRRNCPEHDVKEELPSTAPTASTATQDNGGGKTSSPSARLCSCQGTIASPKKGPQRARSFTSVIGRACNMTQYCSTAQFQQHRQQQQHASSSPHATAAQQNAALPFRSTISSSNLHVSHAHSRRSRRGHANAQPGRRTLLHATKELAPEWSAVSESSVLSAHEAAGSYRYEVISAL